MVRTAGTGRRTAGVRAKKVIAPVKQHEDVLPEEDAIPTDEDVALQQVKQDIPEEKSVVMVDDPATAKYKFRLIRGCHSIVLGLDKNGRAIRKRLTTGDILESNEELDLTFANRFERMTPEMERREKLAVVARRNPTPKIQQIVNKITDDAKAKDHSSPRLRTVNRGANKYDVIREDTGLPINDKFLSLEEAKMMEQAGNAK